MKLLDIRDLEIPVKTDEEFRKIGFEKLFTNEYKRLESLNISLEGEKSNDTKAYDSILFDVVKKIDKNQTLIKLNKSSDKPIILIHDLEKDDTFYTSSIKFEIKKDIEVSIIEVFTSKKTNNASAINRTIKLNENSKIHYAKLENIKEKNSLLFNLDLEQEKNSFAEITNIDFGEGLIINNFRNTLNQKNCSYKINSLIKLENNSNVSNLVKTIHNETDCISDINFKHILDENSKAIFKVKTVVNNTASFSKAFQNSNTILLSDDASIFAQPHLEILIDELEASHGATTGTLNEDELLYLQSRGINKDLATAMLLKAYERQIYDNISQEKIKEFVENFKG